MPTTVNPKLIKDIKKYGAFDISACFNCGNCTAVCPLSEEQGSFPRKLIRLGQIGDRDRILASPEPWLCYYCGECSETCPRKAEPGEYMAALRRYAIAGYEPTGLARWMYKSVGVGLLVTLLVAVILGMFMLGVKPETEAAKYANEWLFKGLVPYSVIHNIGIGIFIVTTLTLLFGVGNALRRVFKGIGKHSLAEIGKAAKTTGVETATMKRHKEEDDTLTPLWQRPSLVHKTILFGFGGLLIATILDFLFIVLIPLTETVWPARILGTISGLALMYGVTVAASRRLRKKDRDVQHSSFADWWLLAYLWVLGATGFWLLGVVSFRQAGFANNLVLLVHAAMAMELVLLMAFTKMAHVVYRPLALFAYYLRSNGTEL
jgi:ferredoxin